MKISGVRQDLETDAAQVVEMKVLERARQEEGNTSALTISPPFVYRTAMVWEVSGKRRTVSVHHRPAQIMYCYAMGEKSDDAMR